MYVVFACVRACVRVCCYCSCCCCYYYYHCYCYSVCMDYFLTIWWYSARFVRRMMFSSAKAATMAAILWVLVHPLFQPLAHSDSAWRWSIRWERIQSQNRTEIGHYIEINEKLYFTQVCWRWQAQYTTIKTSSSGVGERSGEEKVSKISSCVARNMCVHV